MKDNKIVIANDTIDYVLAEIRKYKNIKWIYYSFAWKHILTSNSLSFGNIPICNKTDIDTMRGLDEEQAKFYLMRLLITFDIFKIDILPPSFHFFPIHPLNMDIKHDITKREIDRILSDLDKFEWSYLAYDLQAKALHFLSYDDYCDFEHLILANRTQIKILKETASENRRRKKLKELILRYNNFDIVE